MGEFLNEKVVPGIMRFVNTKAMRALKDGIMYAMPMIMVGALFMLIGNFPVASVTDWLKATGIAAVCSQLSDSTFGVIGIIAAVGIAYTYVKNEGYAGLPAGIISACTFFVLQPGSVDSALLVNPTKSVGAILKGWTGGKGMIGAIVAGLLVGWIYSFFMKKDITIKMPAGVPEGVANAFTSLIPGFVIITGAGVIYALCVGLLGGTPIQMIYTYLSMPLQGMTDSLGGVITMGVMIPFFWLFGIHGATIIGDGIMGPMLLANSAENQAIIDSGMALTIANGGHIVTKQFLDQFMTVTGSGITIGLVVFMLVFAKSKQMKDLGRLAIVPGIFNVNEPVLFGLPIVLNLLMAVPFIVTPVLSGLIEYAALASGLCPLYSGVIVPWTTPAIISGFLVGGWRTALLQAVVLVMSFFTYLPFAKLMDKQCLAQEQAGEEEQAAE
ncbi:MAG: PTS sugar transporter subunit IIC [Coriobacteriaceae bacterium]|nr:MAG: PTS sugar transporter subunit IIC [Coriobacteriaceae bacterium]